MNIRDYLFSKQEDFLRGSGKNVTQAGKFFNLRRNLYILRRKLYISRRKLYILRRKLKNSGIGNDFLFAQEWIFPRIMSIIFEQ